METCSANTFRPGDVVQIQVSFVAFQLRSPGTRMKTYGVRTVLRSVALIDTSVRKVSTTGKNMKTLLTNIQEAEERAFTHPMTYLGPALQVKRQVGYATDNSDLPTKMSKLTLTDAVSRF